MCVRQFDDSLNSAIHNTLSRFATVFIDARAKGSTVGSCLATSHTNNSYGIQDKVKKVRIPEGTRRTPGCRPQDGGRQQGALPAWGFSHGPDALRRDRQPQGPAETGRDLLEGPTATVMILPQVHLRKPCYDFYFIDPRQIKGLSRNGPPVARRGRTGPTVSWTRALCSSDGRCVQRAGT